MDREYLEKGRKREKKGIKREILEREKIEDKKERKF